MSSRMGMQTGGMAEAVPHLPAKDSREGGRSMEATVRRGGGVREGDVSTQRWDGCGGGPCCGGGGSMVGQGHHAN